MIATRTITLWQPPPTTSGRPSSFVISILVHVLAVATVCIISIRHLPTIDVKPRMERYTVRFMDLRAPVFHPRGSSGGGISYPRQQLTKGSSISKGHQAVSAASKPAEQAAVSAKPAAPQAPQPLKPALQTLVQPDAPPNVKLARQIPLPSVLLWSAGNTSSRKIIPPPPQESAAVIIRPKLDPPNHALTVAEVRISPTPFLTQTPALPPSTTSPVMVQGPGAARQVAQTTVKLEAPPTPARVLSVSELSVLEGTVALPLVNQVASSENSQNTSKAGPSNATNRQSANALKVASASENGKSGSAKGEASRSPRSLKEGSGLSAGHQKGSASPGAERPGGTHKGVGDKQAGSEKMAGSNTGSLTARAKGSDPASKTRTPFDAGDESAPGDINMPPDGKFGVTVVGSSLAEQYPETVGIWSSRLAYTVYLHVGLSKNWILQYSLPRDSEAVESRKTIHLEAPWPYHMVRPRLELGDLNADALMIHGFVNLAGRFERLSIVFPPEFTQSKFVIATLEKWHFRPAMENGESAPVEVLLIIPEQPE